MAHDRLMNRKIVAGDEVLEIVKTFDHRYGWGEILGGKS